MNDSIIVELKENIDKISLCSSSICLMFINDHPPKFVMEDLVNAKNRYMEICDELDFDYLYNKYISKNSEMLFFNKAVEFLHDININLPFFYSKESTSDDLYILIKHFYTVRKLVSNI